MSAQQQHTVWTAYLSGTTGTVSVGSCMTPNAAGSYYVIATLAARAAAVRTTCVAGIALTAGDNQNRAVEIQTVGPCPQLITGLAAGTASTLVVDDNGRVARKASPVSGDIICGVCDEDGFAYLDFGANLQRVSPTIYYSELPTGNNNNLFTYVDGAGLPAASGTPARVILFDGGANPGSADSVITGFAGGYDGRRLTLVSKGNSNYANVLEQGSSGSTAANRIVWQGPGLVGGLGASRMLWPGEGIELLWVTETQRWQAASPPQRRGSRSLGFVTPLAAQYTLRRSELAFASLEFGSGTLIILGAPENEEDTYRISVANYSAGNLTFAIDNTGLNAQTVVRPFVNAERTIETVIASIAGATHDDYTYRQDLLVSAGGVRSAHGFTRTP